jgi:hypothetical protein
VNYLHKEKHDYMTHFFCKKEKKRSISECQREGARGGGGELLI